MSRNIVFYPTLSKRHTDLLDPRLTEFSASYLDDEIVKGLKCNLEKENGAFSITLTDDTGNWSPDKKNVKFSGKIELHNLQTLFGINALVEKDAVLGIGLVWKSKASNLRGADTIGLISEQDDDKVISFEKNFETATLRESIEISFVLYCKDPGSGQKQTPQGVTLGELINMTIFLEGIGSRFTVYEKSAPGEPLWAVECDWDEPEYDAFSDSVRVTINTAHPAWALTEDENVKREFLKEIMASSMQIVISELASYQYDESADFELGSVCDAAAYFINRAQVNTDSNADMAKSIRVYLDKSMK